MGEIEEKGKSRGEGGMENGTQKRAHCPGDEWNREIRSAFSKMRSKYRVSGCSNLPFSLPVLRAGARSLATLRSDEVDAQFCSFHGMKTIRSATFFSGICR